jgi:hypothetical protein
MAKIAHHSPIRSFAIPVQAQSWKKPILSIARRTYMNNKSIEEVKAAWEQRLMAQPGVIGVGISLTKDRQEKCIKVYVNRDVSTLKSQIPKQIEGYPVNVEIRGTFQAL